MRLGLNQPYFFPYIGHFSLIQHVDQYWILDTVQYISDGWMHRNRILKPQGGWQYFGVPTKKHPYTSQINDVYLNDQLDWRGKIFRQLEHYRKKAPYYEQTIEVVQKIFEHPWERVSDLNSCITREVCAYLGIKTPIYRLSEEHLNMEQPHTADEWGLNVCRAVPGVTEYWNAPGGASFYDQRKYQAAGIEIKFQKMILDEYPQKGNPFEPGLSIIDVMMFNSVEKIQQMMEHYEFVEV